MQWFHTNALACLFLFLGSSCVSHTTTRRAWWGEDRDAGVEAVVLGYQSSSSEYEPYLSVEVDPAWRDAPRQRLAGSADWTLRDVKAAEVRHDAKVASGVHSSAIYVAEEAAPDAVAGAHRERGKGKSTYLVRTEKRGSRTRAILFGGDGWPMDWVRIAEFEWEEPRAKWGLSDRTQEMFSNFAHAAAVSSFCVR